MSGILIISSSSFVVFADEAESENATESEMLRQVQEVVGGSVQVVIATKGTSIDLGGSK